MKKQHISLIKVLNMNHHFYFNSHLQMALFWKQHSLMIYDWWLIRVLNQIQYEVWSMCVWLVTDSIINKKKPNWKYIKKLPQGKNVIITDVKLRLCGTKIVPGPDVWHYEKKKKKENNCLKDNSESAFHCELTALSGLWLYMFYHSLP